MSRTVQPLVSVLRATDEQLRHLTELAEQKQQAVAQDDLLALNEIMNREQAAALALRGLDQKREQLLFDLGWKDVPLSGLAERCGDREAACAADALQADFHRYRQAAQAAREAVERALQEVEHTLTQMGISPKPEGPGYTAPERPRPSLTDFRA